MVPVPVLRTGTDLDLCLPVCRFYIRTPSLNLPINGCSFECYREVELKICCPGFWGPDCTGGFLLQGGRGL